MHLSSPTSSPSGRFSRSLTRPGQLQVALAFLLCQSCGQPAIEPPKEIVTQLVFGDETRARELAATTDSEGMLWLVLLDLPTDPQNEPAELKLMLASGLDPATPLALTTIATGSNLGPATLAPLDGGGVFIVWEDDQLIGRSAKTSMQGEANPSISLAPTVVVPTGEAKPRLPHATALSTGGIGLTWQAPEGQSMRAFFAHRNSAGNWSPPQLVSQNDNNGTSDSWRPRIASAPGGPIQIAYDRFEHGASSGFDIWLATSASPGEPFTQQLIAGGPTYQGLPDLGIDPKGRTWITYEEAPHFGQAGSLRSRRQTRLVAIDKSGALSHAILPRHLSTSQRGDFPKLLVTPYGLAITRRLPQNNYEPRNPARKPFFATWLTSVLGFDADGEGFDLEIASTDGDNENDSTLLFGPSGFQLYSTSDGRSDTFEVRYSFEVPIENLWQLSHSSLPLPIGFPKLEPGSPPSLLQAQNKPLPQGLAHSKRDPLALFGDLHRHTNLSRCAGRLDGVFLDAVRYARGPGALDFLSVTDHYQHLTPGSYWRELRNVERWNAPGSLVVLPGLERTVADKGHQNLIFSSKENALKAGSRFAPSGMDEQTFVAIPHMTAMPRNNFDWPTMDTDRQRLVEVHQGLRGSYEGLDPSKSGKDEALGQVTWPMAASQASAASGWITSLAAGLGEDQTPPGLISSSDHGASSFGFAGIVLAPGAEREISRSAIFAALHQRRTFATTGPAPGHSTRHRIAVEAKKGLLLIHVDRAGLNSLTVLENGREISQLAGEKSPSKQFLSERRLAVRAHLRRQGERTFTLSGTNLTFANAGYGKPSPGLDPITLKDGQIRLPLPPDISAEMDFMVSLSPAGSAPYQLHFELASNTKDKQPIALDLDLEILLESPTRRFWLGPKDKRPFFDLELLPNPIAAGTGPVEFSLEGRAAHAIYYVRAAWQDGHHAWSRMLRADQK